MSETLEAESLTTFEITHDGGHVRLHAATATGAPMTFAFSSDCLRQLIMSLPSIARQAMQLRYGNDRMRLVYPIGDWQVESSGEHDRSVIVTMSTADGFEVSFALSPTNLHDLAMALRGSSECTRRASSTLN